MASKRIVSTACALLLLSTLSCEKGGKKLPVEPPFLGKVEGVVTADESTLARVTVQLSGSASRTAVTSNTGEFSFPNLPAGSYIVELDSYPDDFEFASTSKTTSLYQGRGSAKVDFKGAKKKDGHIGGAVMAESNGLGEVTVSLSGQASRSVQTDTQGSYEFTQLPRGDYLLEISGFDPALYSFPITQQLAEVKNGNLVEVHFAGILVPYPPAAPTDLAAEVGGSATVSLGWTDASDDETRFEVHRKEGTEGSWSQIGAPEADVESFEDFGLTPNTRYGYRVRACNSVGCSDYSNEASIVTSEVEPEAPTGLTAEAYGSSGIDLEWADASNNETEFRIYRKQSLVGTWSRMGTEGGNVTSFEDTGLDPNTIYLYRVRACNGAGCSSYSNEADATTWDVAPDAPTGLTATATGPEAADLTWTDVADNENGFRVERRQSGGSLAFQPIPVPDAGEGDGHFAFAIPLRSADRASLMRLRVSGGGRTPASTGQVLSFARGGRIDLPVFTGEIDVTFSDGLRTTDRVRRIIR